METTHRDWRRSSEHRARFSRKAPAKYALKTNALGGRFTIVVKRRPMFVRHAGDTSRRALLIDGTGHVLREQPDAGTQGRKIRTLHSDGPSRALSSLRRQ